MRVEGREVEIVWFCDLLGAGVCMWVLCGMNGLAW